MPLDRKERATEKKSATCACPAWTPRSPCLRTASRASWQNARSPNRAEKRGHALIASPPSAWYFVHVQRTCFDVLAELFARDVDRELLRRSRAKTPTERIQWLEEMQEF